MSMMLKWLRSRLFTALLLRTARAAGTGCRAHGLVRASNLFIGNDCHFNGARVFGRGRVEIGDHFHSATGLQIMTEIHNYHGISLPYDDTTIIKDVTIGRNVWVGKDVMILGGVSIGEGAIIQARSVVARSVPALAIAGGHPAVEFARRDADHYRRLVIEQRK